MPPTHRTLVRVPDGDRAFYFHAPTARVFATEPRDDEALAVLAELREPSPERLRAALVQQLGLAADEAGPLAEQLAELGLLGSPALHPPAPQSVPITQLKLHVSSTCNLRCGYCYQGDTTGTPARGMTIERARDAIDWLFSQGAAGSPVALMFFGGEPMLSFPVVQEASGYAREQEQRTGRALTLSMVTNGTLITAERAATLGALGFGIGMSIDGAPEAHDRLRVFASGRGSYAQARRALPWLQDAGCRVNALITVGRHNNHVRRSVEHLLDEGFDGVKATPMASTDPSMGLGAEDYERLREDVFVLADRYADRACAGERYGFSNIHGDVAAVHAGRRRHYPCTAGLSSAACTTEGELYLCHRFADREDFGIGSIEGGLDGDALASFREQMHLRERTDCQQCWARHLCGGGCHQHNELDNGDMRRATAVRCDYLRAWYYKVLQVYARIATVNPAFLDADGT